MSLASPDTQAENPRWFSCAASVVGHVRKINEDAYMDARESGLWVVADGMGGHSRGDRASQQIITSMQQFQAGEDIESDLNLLENLLHSANAFCHQESAAEVMGSTVVALYVHDDQAHLIWAGDSRAYRVRDGKLQQLTEDHSLVQELHRLGELTEDEAENHPSANVITRAVGVNENLELQVAQFELEAGDRFLLCSDGLFKDVLKAELEQNLNLPSMELALDRMVKLALKRGGTDNITAIVVQIPTSLSD